MSVFVRQKSVPITYKPGEPWTILSPVEQAIKAKIEAIGIPLKQWNINIQYGVKTGLNDAFIITDEVRKKLIEDDPKSAEIIRPILRGRDIYKDRIEFANLYVITAYKGINEIIESRYPAVFRHLKTFETQLKQRGQVEGKPGKTGSMQHHWTELDNNISLEKLDDFSKLKIVFSRIAGDEAKFAMDDAGFVTNDTGYIITGESISYLQEQLTSPEMWFAFNKFYMGGGVSKEFKVNNLLALPVPKEGSSLIFTEEEKLVIKMWNQM